MKKPIIYSLLILLTAGCAASKMKSTTGEGPLTENLQIGSTKGLESKIIFLTIKIIQTDSIRDTYSFKVINKIFADGILKKNAMSKYTPEPHYLYCEILDANRNRTDYVRVENPLLKVYEFNEDPASPLQKRTFKSMEGTFNLRFQLDNNSKYLTIYKASPDYKTLKKIYDATI